MEINTINNLPYNPELDSNLPEEEKGWLDYADLRNILPIDYKAMKDEAVKNISDIQETYNPDYEGMFSDPESNYESLWDMLNFELLGRGALGVGKGIIKGARNLKTALGGDTHRLYRGIDEPIGSIDELSQTSHIKDNRVVGTHDSGKFRTGSWAWEDNVPGKKLYDKIFGYRGSYVDEARNLDDLTFTTPKPAYAAQGYGSYGQSGPGSLMSFEVPEWYIKKHGLHKGGDSPMSLLKMMDSGIISFPGGIPRKYLKGVDKIQGPSRK